MLWLIIVLISCIVILLTIIFRYRKDIKYISAQIEESQGEYTNIRMNTLDKSLEDLVIKINNIYDLNQQATSKIKHREEELRHSIANMTHDLRTPLTSIMGYLQLIKSANLTEEEIEKYFNIIEKRTETLQELVESFHELSRLNSNEYQFELKTVNLSNILCETVALFYHDFTNKNIEPIINIEENIPNIISDETALTRIFTNLINNMLKHGKDTVIINLAQKKDKLVAEFINHAPDLQQDQISHIFDRFFTGDRARSNKNTGLGLYIAKTLAEQLGHEIGAELIDETLKITVSFSINSKREP